MKTPTKPRVNAKGYPYYRLELHGALVLFTLMHIAKNTSL